MVFRLVFAIFFWTCLLLLLKSSLIAANEANVNCLRNFRAKVEDPNDYLTSWDFKNESAGFICKFSGVTCWHDDENRVLSIKLSGYGLRGLFPLAIKNCSDLTGLDLSRNNFSGPLPSNLTFVIPLVTTLDLSYNRFSGEIPASITNVTFLSSLNLQNNQFTGQLPLQLVLLRRLTKFNVANNRLTGPIPSFKETLKFGQESFANNLGLCGKPLDACESPTTFLGKDFIIAGIGGYIGSVVGSVLFFYFRKKDVVSKRPSRR